MIQFFSWSKFASWRSRSVIEVWINVIIYCDYRCIIGPLGVLQYNIINPFYSYSSMRCLSVKGRQNYHCPRVPISPIGSLESVVWCGWLCNVVEHAVDCSYSQDSRSVVVCDSSAWVKPSTLIVHSETTGCHVSGLMGMAGYQKGESGVIEEGRNVTTQLAC